MANYPISGVRQPFVKTIIANQSGHVTGVGASWTDARAGSSTLKFTGQMSIGPLYTAPLYRLQRGFLQFEVPENLSRIDGSVVASIYVDGFVGITSQEIVATSVDYTDFSNPWNTWTTRAVWDAVQFNAGAAYMYVDRDWETKPST